MRAVLRTAALLAAVLLAGPARAEDAVTEWTVAADRLGQGGANWHSLAIMHMAMHDAAQAVEPRYASWAAAVAPPATAARPLLEAALAGAAAESLAELHPEGRAGIAALLRSALGQLPAGPERDAGFAVGQAIGHATVLRRSRDGYGRIRPFAASTAIGRWRPAPGGGGSNTTDAQPFLFPTRDWPGERPPPGPGSEALARDAVESNALGIQRSRIRTAAQTEAAAFWAYQSSQRGIILLAVRLLDADGAADLIDRARLMSLLTAAMADAAILTWAEKERYSSWRPVTVLRQGIDGVYANPDWAPMIETPPHPEYPSGHAADCYTGAGALSRLFGATGPVEYVAQSALEGGETAAVGMGQHAQVGGLHAMERRFPSLTAAAEECANSRIWAGAHFRSANEESRRLAAAIVARAAAALPRRAAP